MKKAILIIACLFFGYNVVSAQAPSQEAMIKYNLFNDVVLNTGFSIYDNLQFDDSDDVQSTLFEDIELDSIKNDSLRYFLDNSLKSFSFQQGRLFFNAPKNKGFIGLSKDDFLIK